MAKLPTPEESKPSSAETIEGNPEFRTWPLDESYGGRVQTGIWEATPGLTHCIKDDVLEYCRILQGVVQITENGGQTRTYRAGDSFIFKPGFRGTWRTVETVRKLYIVVVGKSQIKDFTNV